MLGVPPQKLCRDTQQVIIGEDIEENKSKYFLPAFTQLPPVQTFNFQELSRINNYILFLPMSANEELSFGYCSTQYVYSVVCYSQYC